MSLTNSEGRINKNPMIKVSNSKIKLRLWIESTNNSCLKRLFALQEKNKHLQFDYEQLMNSLNQLRIEKELLKEQV